MEEGENEVDIEGYAIYNYLCQRFIIIFIHTIVWEKEIIQKNMARSTLKKLKNIKTLAWFDSVKYS